jgi:hypothetical protein
MGADSFSGSMDPRRLIHKLFFSRMIGVSLVCCALSSVGFLCHRIPLQWQPRKRPKQQPVASATHLRANVVTVRSWRTRLRGWIIHPFPLFDSCIGNTIYFGVVQHLLISVNDIDMSCALQGKKRGIIRNVLWQLSGGLNVTSCFFWTLIDCYVRKFVVI